MKKSDSHATTNEILCFFMKKNKGINFWNEILVSHHSKMMDGHWGKFFMREQS